jgi:hypothetical protein
LVMKSQAYMEIAQRHGISPVALAIGKWLSHHGLCNHFVWPRVLSPICCGYTNLSYWF